MRPRRARPSVNLTSIRAGNISRVARPVRWSPSTEVVEFYKQLPVVSQEGQANLFNEQREIMKEEFYEATIFDTEQCPEPGLTFREISLRDEAKNYVMMMNIYNSLAGQESEE